MKDHPSLVKVHSQPQTINSIECFQCEDCDYDGDSLDQIIEHVILSHKKKSDDKFKCDKCSSDFDSRKELLYHVKVTHLEIESEG